MSGSIVSDAPPRAKRKPLYTSLFFQLIVAIVGGILVGWIWPDFASNLKPLADGFIKLIKMLIAPIIFCTVVLGIAHVGDLKAVGRIGVKALIYFEVVTTFALVFGLLVGNVMQPGAGFSIDPQTLASGAEAIATKTGNGELPHTVEFLLGIIPTSVIGAFADNVLIQVLFFAVLFGLALAKLGEKGPPVILTVIDQASHAFFTIIGWVMKLAPLGAFGAMAYIIGQYGIESPASYGNDLSICLLFLAQALEFDLSHGEQITALMVLMLTSKGMAGVPGSSFLPLSATVRSAMARFRSRRSRCCWVPTGSWTRCGCR
jgi:aerobic C4-dicarboxylate transport protein